MQVRYRTLPKAMIDSMKIKTGDFVMDESAFQAAVNAVAEVRLEAQQALSKLRRQEEKGKYYRASLDSIQQEMTRIVAEKDAQIRYLNEQYDSLIESQNTRIEAVAIDLEIRMAQGEVLKKESFKTEMEALRNADELSDQIKNSDQVVGDWLKKKRKSARAVRRAAKRTGILRELLYHPTTTPVGRVLIGGLVISFTALTTVTIISLTNDN